MKAVIEAAALSLAMLIAGAAPATAQEVHIHVYGDKGVESGPGPHSMAGGPERGHGRHPRMHHDGDHDRGHHARQHGADHHKGWAGRSHGHGGRMGHGRRMDRVMDLVELYDRDGDGKVTQAEIDQGRADRLAEFDRDGNGTLSLQEYEALWLDAMRERMVNRFQSHDADGNGQVTVEEFSERTGRLVMRGDRNEDGAISLKDARRGDRGRHGMRDRHADDE